MGIVVQMLEAHIVELHPEEGCPGYSLDDQASEEPVADVWLALGEAYYEEAKAISDHTHCKC